MPKLKHLLCSIEHADSNVPFCEYGTSYGDGFVQTHIVAPPTPIPFTLHLSSTGYIAPGLAMFVFMDGVYQCNRNIDGLVPPSEATDMSRTEFEFRVRQKEQMLNNDMWIGREWRFEEFNIGISASLFSVLGANVRDRYAVTGETQSHTASPSVAHPGSLGLIEVVILRCLNYADPIMVPPTAPSSRDNPWTPKLEPSPSSLGGLFFDGAGDSHLLKPTSFSIGGIEDQSTRSESKTVRFGEGEGWGYSHTGPSGTWHAMDGNYDRSYRRVFRPEEMWERRTQAYEHYHNDWQNPNGQRDEPRGRDIHQDGRNRQQDSFNPNRAHLLPINNQRLRIRPEGNGRAQHPNTPTTSRGPPTYRPLRLSPRRPQRCRRQIWYPASEVEASERNDDRYTVHDQYDRSGYVNNCGDWVGEEFGNLRFGWTGDSLLEPQRSGPPGTLQDEPTDLGHWKAPSENNDRNTINDARATPQDGDDIGKYNSHRSGVANTWKNDAGPDVCNWVTHGGSGTWRPPAANDIDFHRVNREGRNALDLPTAKANSGVTHVGQESRRGGQTSDANRSNQGVGKNVRSSRENSKNGGDRKTDGNNNANENASKRGGSKSNGRGCNERNWNGGREIDNKGNRNGSGISGANRNTSRRGSRLNERGYHDGNGNEGGENDDRHDQRNNQSEGRGSRANAGASESGRAEPNECGHISGNWGNENRSNSGRVSWVGGDERTNRSNISQVNIDSGGGNKGPPNREENVWDRGSRHGNLPDADQGYPKNKGGNKCIGGNDDLPNRSGSRGCSCGDGKSYNGGGAWDGNGGNPAKPDCDTNGLRASGNYTRSNRGENATNCETGNTQGGEGRDWGGGRITQEQNAPNGDSGDGGWNNNTGGKWGGENGNEGGYPDGNGNTDNRGGGNGESRAWEGGGDNGEWDGGNNPNPNPDTTNCDWDGVGNDNGNGDNAHLYEFNNEANGSASNAYNADETNNCKEQTPNTASNQQTDTGEAAVSNAPPAEPILSYAKPYWSSWTAESERVVSPTEPNTSRKRADSFQSGEELPLYSINKDQLGDHSVRHQVRHGRPEYYVRNLRKPVYLDTMAEPYAVFAFKYRSKEALEILLKAPIEDDEEYEKSRLMLLPKDQIIQELLRMKASTNSSFTRHNDSASEENKDNTLANNGGGAESGGDMW